MFFGKKRVELDLKKIMEANLPNGELKKERAEVFNLEKGDMLAMTLAVISLILPYLLAFIGIMGMVVLLMKFIWS